jgi:AraC-like DNA-binding protein
MKYAGDTASAKARTLLLRGISISAAADASGFQNMSHFNNLFKKSTGYTPVAFRKKYANNRRPDGTNAFG